MMITIFDKLISIYKNRKEKRFLKKHNVNSWFEYNYLYDPDWNRNATALTDIFHGYSVIMILPNIEWFDGFFGPMIETKNIIKWCEENCSDKYRVEILAIYMKDNDGSVVRATPYDGNNITSDEELIVVFKSKNDATDFIMLYDGIELQSSNKTRIIYVGNEK